MAHRGRISILHNVLGKSLKSICNDFSEVDEQYGDVKYHLGTRAIVTVNYTSSMDEDEDKDEDHENRGKRGDLDRANDGINEGVSEGYGNGETIYNNDNISSSSSSSSSSSNSCSDMRTKTLKINLAANPSHLEAVNAVVLGRCKLSSFISIFVSFVLSNLSLVASIY